MHRTIPRTDLPTTTLILALTVFAAVIGCLSRHALLVLPVMAGLMLSLYAAVRLWHIYGSRGWPVTIGRYLDGALEVVEVWHGGGRRAYWFPRIEYSYCFNGRSYCGTRLALDLKSVWSADGEEAAKLLDRLRKARLNVYVHPRWPRLAVLFYGATPERIAHYWALLLGGTLICATAPVVASLFGR